MTQTESNSPQFPIVAASSLALAPPHAIPSSPLCTVGVAHVRQTHAVDTARPAPGASAATLWTDADARVEKRHCAAKHALVDVI